MQTAVPEKRSIENNLTRVDKVFQALVTFGAFVSMVVLAAIGGFQGLWLFLHHWF